MFEFDDDVEAAPVFKKTEKKEKEIIVENEESSPRSSLKKFPRNEKVQLPAGVKPFIKTVKKEKIIPVKSQIIICS